MTDHSAFFFLHFLLCYLHSSLSTSHCEKYVKNKAVNWVSIKKEEKYLYLNNCDVKTIQDYQDNHLSVLELLNLSFNQIETLPNQFLSVTKKNVTLYLENNNLKSLPGSILQNKNLKICSLDCINAIKDLHEHSDISISKAIFKKCESLKLEAIIVPLLLVILLLCALGLVWYWKRYRYRYSRNFALRKFLHKKRHQNAFDSLRTPHTPTEYGGPKHLTPNQIKDKPSLLYRNDADQSYENVETGPLRCAEECLTGLYENTNQVNSEEHLYGNESSSEYYNVQKPHLLNYPPVEEIYILPD
ncbi:protein GAPT [Monodelphis domestica]|uniref:protein GAPT n=1 Tax=Monodelphis domestica TaxID=13616 RepID=UPI0024E22776|nr:protein GAPT [Monodelphis domestica]